MKHSWKVSYGENSKSLLGEDKGFPVHVMKAYKGKRRYSSTHY